MAQNDVGVWAWSALLATPQTDGLNTSSRNQKVHLCLWVWGLGYQIVFLWAAVLEARVEAMISVVFIANFEEL